MIHHNTVRHSFYATVVVIILTLTGIFGTFASRDVVRGELSLSTLTLVIMVGTTAYMTAALAKEMGVLATIVNGLIGAAMVTVGLTLVVILETSISLRFVFQNLTSLNESTLTAGKEISLESGEIGGLLEMILFSLACGLAASLFVRVPKRLRETLLIGAALTVTVSMVQAQINRAITLPDALALAVTFAAGYAMIGRLAPDLWSRIVLGAAFGVAIGIIVSLAGSAGALEPGGLLYGNGSLPVILGMAVEGHVIALLVVLTLVGIVGAMASSASLSVHNGFIYLLTALIVLGIINWQDNGGSVWVGLALMFALISATVWFVPQSGERASRTFESYSVQEQRNLRWGAIFIALLVFLVAPRFMGLYVSNVFNQIAMYAIMGIGLNVMIGYAGLLDLGYVASFAIGAYTLGILTTPNLITCGGVHPDNIAAAQIAETCTGVMSFWTAWPLCVLFSALTGMLLGIPVLRLRGDYLAIVTLGFGEIINRVILSNDFKPLLGGAQGVSPIPSPVINLTGLNADWYVQLSSSTSMYYLFLFGVIITAFVVFRLANSRTGRAWRAVKADEDVAQAMGINLMYYKLLAFGVSSAFAGLGGAAFGASVQGIFPRSFTLLVSINVLSLIIIGGMGSIPGVIIGALILIGLPELLRELDAYRLLAFGALLVTVMLVKPEGLLPPKPPELAEQAAHQQEVRHE